MLTGMARKRRDDPRAIGDLALYWLLQGRPDLALLFAPPAEHRVYRIPPMKVDGSFNFAPVLLAAASRWDELREYFQRIYLDEGWQGRELNSPTYTARVLLAAAAGAKLSTKQGRWFQRQILEPWLALLCLLAVPGQPQRRRRNKMGTSQYDIKATMLEGPYVLPTGMRANAYHAVEPITSPVLAELLSLKYRLRNAEQQRKSLIPETWRQYMEWGTGLRSLAGQAVMAQRVRPQLSPAFRRACLGAMLGEKDQVAVLVNKYMGNVKLWRGRLRIDRLGKTDVLAAIDKSTSVQKGPVVASRVVRGQLSVLAPCTEGKRKVVRPPTIVWSDDGLSAKADPGREEAWPWLDARPTVLVDTEGTRMVATPPAPKPAAPQPKTKPKPAPAPRRPQRPRSRARAKFAAMFGAFAAMMDRQKRR